jgi:thiol-disulfide isomerase/thioredoxin
MRNFIIFTLLFSPLLAKASDKPKVNFFNGNLLNIQETAKTEGKLYVYDFVASWCTPCKIMEETTFNDEILADYIAENYIFAKIDIEDFDGIGLKQQYQINSLPTILVFNQDGEIVARHESVISSAKLLDLLKNCNTEANGAGKKHAPTELFLEKTPILEAPNIEFREKKIAEKIEISNEIVTKPSNYYNALKVKREKPAPQKHSANLYQLDIFSSDVKGFTIQTCALTQYENVLKHYEIMKNTYPNQPILLSVENTKDKTIYKILVGDFKSKAAAELFKSNNAIEGYIKDLRHKK